MGEAAPAAPAWTRFGPWRREVRAYLELLALTGVAVAQPTFDLLGKNTGVFIALRTTGLETIALAVLVVLVPPTALWLVEVLIGLLVARIRPAVHAALGGFIVAVIAIEVLKKQTSLTSPRLVELAVPVGVLGGLLILRFQLVRLWLRYLALAPAAFALLFLLASPVTGVVFERGHGTAAAAAVHVGRPARVVMIVLDEMPTESLLDGTGHVDASLFPQFAALASDSTWFRNDTTVAPYTEEAVPAVLTGDEPEGDFKPPVTADYPHNLFTLLGGAYRMNVHESITRLCPSSICAQATAMHQSETGFRALVDATSTIWREFASPHRTVSGLQTGAAELDRDPFGTADRFVRSIRPGNGPELDFLHILLPHQPWHLRGDGQDDDGFETAPGLYHDLAWSSAWSAATGRQRHLLQVQATDRVLGQVVAKLRRIGAYDHSLVVVTADHGVAFTAHHAVRGVAPENYPQILWTPMFVHRPGQTTGAVDDHPVRSVDIVPTIADVLDVRLPWKVDGRSMFAPATNRGSPHVLQWDVNEVRPPAGSEFVAFPGDAGFASVLDARASATGGDPDLRLYRIGAFGDLVGRPAAPLVHGATAVSATIDDRARFDHVHPRARSIPWTFVHGTYDLARDGIPLAIVVNGIVASVTETSMLDPRATRAAYWATLPPQLFRAGPNRVEIDAIVGTPGAPALSPLRLR